MTDSHDLPQRSMTNGGDMGLGMALGRLQATLDHQTPILANINQNIEALPQAIASQLKTYSITSAQDAPTTSQPKISDYTDLVKALAWLALILGVLLKRIAFPDAAAYLKGMLG